MRHIVELSMTLLILLVGISIGSVFKDLGSIDKVEIERSVASILGGN